MKQHRRSRHLPDQHLVQAARRKRMWLMRRWWIRMGEGSEKKVRSLALATRGQDARSPGFIICKIIENPGSWPPACGWLVELSIYLLQLLPHKLRQLYEPVRIAPLVVVPG